MAPLLWAYLSPKRRLTERLLRRSLQDPPCPEVPASWLQGHPGLEVIADRGAAAALQLS